MTAIKKVKITDLFGRGRLISPKPDQRWVLPSCYIGLELEVENCSYGHTDPTQITTRGWAVKSDGSLVNGREFVFNGPRMGEDISVSVDAFFEYVDSGMRYQTSPRTGTHIHLNWLDESTFDSVHRLIALMYCIEPAVFEYADPGRKWCGFCMQITDLNATSLRTIFVTESTDVLKKEFSGAGRDRYFGTNLQALSKFGTVEFRHFPGVSTKDRLEEWINLCMSLKKACCEDERDVVDLVNELSTEQGIRDYLERMFLPDIANKLIGYLDLGMAVQRMENLQDILRVVPARFATPAPAQMSRAGKAVVTKLFPSLTAKMEAKDRRAAMMEEFYTTRMTEERRAQLAEQLLNERTV